MDKMDYEFDDDANQERVPWGWLGLIAGLVWLAMWWLRHQ